MVKVDDKRRALLFTSAAAFSVLGGRRAFGQAVPSSKLTIQYLSTSKSVTLLYSHFNLIWSLSVSVYISQNGVTLDTPEMLATLDMPPFVSSGEIWPYLRQLAEPDNSDQRESIRNLLESVSDPLADGKRADEHRRLVENLTVDIRFAGISPEAPVNSEAIDILSHVERIAAVTIDADNQGSYLCRIFPFKYFC